MRVRRRRPDAPGRRSGLQWPAGGPQVFGAPEGGCRGLGPEAEPCDPRAERSTEEPSLLWKQEASCPFPNFGKYLGLSEVQVEVRGKFGAPRRTFQRVARKTRALFSVSAAQPLRPVSGVTHSCVPGPAGSAEGELEGCRLRSFSAPRSGAAPYPSLGAHDLDILPLPGTLCGRASRRWVPPCPLGTGIGVCACGGTSDGASAPAPSLQAARAALSQAASACPLRGVALFSDVQGSSLEGIWDKVYLQFFRPLPSCQFAL